MRVVAVTPQAQIRTVFGIEEGKAHLRVEHDDDDALIESFIRAAQGAIERVTDRILTPRTMRWTARGWPRLPSGLRLFVEPVTAILAVEHLQEDGTFFALPGTAWRWREEDGDQLWPAIGGDWPVLAHGLGDAAVRVTFEAGYEAGLCEPDLSAAVKLLMASYYTNRSAVVIGTISSELPMAVDMLCRPYRRMLL